MMITLMLMATNLLFSGHKNVMFIHTYYSHMMEVLSRAEMKAFTDKHTESGQ